MVGAVLVCAKGGANDESRLVFSGADNGMAHGDDLGIDSQGYGPLLGDADVCLDETFTPACLLAVQPAPGGSPTDEAGAGEDSEPQNVAGRPGETADGGGGEGAEPESGAGAAYPADSEFAQAAFLEGYDTAGGPAEYREHVIGVVECESTWNPGAVSDAGQLGLLQFEPSTWASYARPDMDWRDPFDQGWTGANLIGDLLERGISPGSSAGWAVCWWR
jgi:hypothetical protein